MSDPYALAQQLDEIRGRFAFLILGSLALASAYVAFGYASVQSFALRCAIPAVGIGAALAAGWAMSRSGTRELGGKRSATGIPRATQVGLMVALFFVLYAALEPEEVLVLALIAGLLGAAMAGSSAACYVRVARGTESAG
ncbi:hypothetical protein GCM10009623_36620 [Nocardioides aestuarii]|uniref:Uncharacterized protein n=1 Tax=Nocardioides aestuarii TaxID=252231 RepID=A0ABW4TTE9_9ACTN